MSNLHSRPCLAAALLPLALGACGKMTAADPRDGGPLVQAAAVREADEGARSFTGVVAARVQSDLGFRVGGKVVARLVDTGESVRRGQALMRIDPTDLGLAEKGQRETVAALRARAAQASADEARLRGLAEAGAISAQSYDQAKAAADSARAELAAGEASARAAGDAHGYAELRADADGVIVETLAEPGQVVAAGQVVIRLAQQGPREAAVSFPETVRPAIGSTATAEVAGASGVFAARLRQLSDAADPRTRTFDARFVLTGEGGACSARTHRNRRARRRRGAGVLVPIGALHDPGSGAGVWIVPGGGGVGGARSRSRASTLRTRWWARALPPANVSWPWRRPASPRADGAYVGPGRCPMSTLNLSALAVRERAVTLFVLIAIVVAGALAFFNLGRAEDPTFTVKGLDRGRGLAGATAQQMQDLVAEPLEKRLQELDDYDRVETFTRPGYAFLTLTLKDSTPPKAVPEQFYQARKKLGDEAAHLPQGVLGPFVNDEYSDTDFALYALKAKGMPPRELTRWAETLRQRVAARPRRQEGRPDRRASGADLRRFLLSEARHPGCPRARHPGCARAPEHVVAPADRSIPPVPRSSSDWTAPIRIWTRSGPRPSSPGAATFTCPRSPRSHAVTRIPRVSWSATAGSPRCCSAW